MNPDILQSDAVFLIDAFGYSARFRARSSFPPHRHFVLRVDGHPAATVVEMNPEHRASLRDDIDTAGSGGSGTPLNGDPIVLLEGGPFLPWDNRADFASVVDGAVKPTASRCSPFCCRLPQLLGEKTCEFHCPITILCLIRWDGAGVGEPVGASTKSHSGVEINSKSIFGPAPRQMRGKPGSRTGYPQSIGHAHSLILLPPGREQ